MPQTLFPTKTSINKHVGIAENHTTCLRIFSLQMMWYLNWRPNIIKAQKCKECLHMI